MFRGVRLALTLTIVLLLLAPSLSLVAQSLPPDPRFGAVEAFYDPQAAQDLNLGWERILFLWNEFQPNGPDQLNIFQVQDSWLTEAAAHGRQVVGLIERTPPWATDGVAGSGVPRGLNLPIDDPNNVWASFVRALVKHYADRVDHWIIWNEPDIRPPNFGVQFDGTEADYYQLVKVAYQVAKQENPNAVIHLAGLTFYQDHKYLQHFIDVAKKDRSAAANHDYFDVATLHIYFTTDEVYNVAQIIRNTLRLNGLKQPMWINEANAFPSTDPLNPWYQPTWTVSLDQQADFLVHSFALSLAAGADRIAVYKLIDVPPPLPGWYPEGVIRSDGSHRPAYAALKVITTYFRNTRAARLVRIGSTDIVTLDRGGQTTRIAWTRSASAATVLLPALAQQATLIGVNGATQTIVAVNNQYKLSLPGATCDDPRHGCFIGGSPIILVEDAPSKSGGSVIVSTVTPSAPCINCTPTPTLTLQSTQTITPTSTASPQPTATSTATPTASPTYTFTPTPTVRPAPTSTPNIASTDNDPPIGLFAIGAALVLMLIIIWRGRK